MVFSAKSQNPNFRPADGRGLTADQEEELFRRAVSGDRASFGQLVLATQDRLHAAILRIVGDREEARDLTQEAYVKALSGLHAFRSKARFTTWLYRIAINLAINQIRRVRRHRQFLLESSGTARNGASVTGIGGGQADELLRRVNGPGVAPAALPPDQAAAREAHQMVLTALSQLDAEFRAVLVMRDIEELEYQEIAEVLELPLGSVKSRLFRARLALREALQSLRDEAEARLAEARAAAAAAGRPASVTFIPIRGNGQVRPMRNAARGPGAEGGNP